MCLRRGGRDSEQGRNISPFERDVKIRQLTAAWSEVIAGGVLLTSPELKEM